MNRVGTLLVNITMALSVNILLYFQSAQHKSTIAWSTIPHRVSPNNNGQSHLLLTGKTLLDKSYYDAQKVCPVEFYQLAANDFGHCC